MAQPYSRIMTSDWLSWLVARSQKGQVVGSKPRMGEVVLLLLWRWRRVLPDIIWVPQGILVAQGRVGPVLDLALERRGDNDSAGGENR